MKQSADDRDLVRVINVGKSLNDKIVYNHNSCKYFCVSWTNFN